MEKISTKQARDHFSEVLNRVVFGGERYTLTRHGNEVAVIISPEEWKAIEHLSIEPRPHGVKCLQGQFSQYYRIIYSIDDGNLVVLVLKIGHRQGVYTDRV